MKTKLKKAFIYSVSIILLSGGALYASMEDYQKERMAQFLSSVLSDSNSSKS